MERLLAVSAALVMAVGAVKAFGEGTGAKPVDVSKVSFRGDGMRQDTLALAVLEAAKVLGREATYREVTCLSGNAFGPAIDLGEDCTSWWHCESAMGGKGLPTVLAKVGLAGSVWDTLKFEGDNSKEEDLRKHRQKTLGWIGEKRNAGGVVLTLGGCDYKNVHGFVSWCWAGVVTGTEEDGTIRVATINGHADNVIKWVSPLWEVRKGEVTLTQAEADAACLRNAVLRVYGQGPWKSEGKARYGLAAMDEWIRQMEEVQGFCAPCWKKGKSWTDAQDNAVTTHAAAKEAASYLVEMAARSSPAARPHVVAAAGHYLNIERMLAPFAAKGGDGAALGTSELQVAAADLEGEALAFGAILPGKFMMGGAGRKDNAYPPHEVEMSKPFFMGRYHVTRGQFRAFVKETAYRTDAEKEGFTYGTTKWVKIPETWERNGMMQNDEHAVACVSWNDAKAFCEWASKKSGHTVRLPTEAEWEYCAKAGRDVIYPWGVDAANARGQLNAEDGIEGWYDGWRFTSPVGRFAGNGFALFDMVGQMWQPCGDGVRVYDEKAVKDPVGAETKKHAVRGGTWDYPASMCRTMWRNPSDTNGQSWDTGFRVMMESEAGGAGFVDGYKKFIGDLAKQKTHAAKVLRPVRAEMRAAAAEIALALAKRDGEKMTVAVNGRVYDLAWVTGGNFEKLGLAGKAAVRAEKGAYAGHVNPLYNLHCEMGPALMQEMPNWETHWQTLARGMKGERFALVAMCDGKLVGHVRFFKADVGRLRDVPAELHPKGEKAWVISAGCVDAEAAGDALDVEMLVRAVGYLRGAKGAEKIAAVGWPDVLPIAMWGEGMRVGALEAACFKRGESLGIDAGAWRDIKSGSHGGVAKKLAEASGAGEADVAKRWVMELDFTARVKDPRFK